jgi:type II secretory pathway component PulJ
MIRRRRQRGMTLLEVVLAIALSVGVMGGAMAFYRQAVDVRTSLEGRVQTIEAQRLVMDRLTNEFRGALAVMQGEAGEVGFFAAHLPGPAAWAVRKSTEEAIPPESDLEWVGYRLRTVEDEDSGEETIVGLERTSRKTERLVEDEEELETALLSSEVKFFAMRYYHQGVWLTSWQADLPQAVEITLGATPLPADTDPQDYPYETFRRVVYLPAAGAGGGGRRR